MGSLLHGKLDHVRRLLAEGYVLEEVESERGLVEATFRRGRERLVVRFLPTEAERLLLEGPLRLESLKRHSTT